MDGHVHKYQTCAQGACGCCAPRIKWSMVKWCVVKWCTVKWCMLVTCRQMVDMRLATEKAESYLQHERGMRTALGDALRCCTVLTVLPCLTCCRLLHMCTGTDAAPRLWFQHAVKQQHPAVCHMHAQAECILTAGRATTLRLVHMLHVPYTVLHCIKRQLMSPSCMCLTHG